MLDKLAFIAYNKDIENKRERILIMTRKITRKEMDTIDNNLVANWAKPFCNYTLTKDSEDNFICNVRVKTWFYLVATLPLHLIKAVQLMWDGGLVEFSIDGPHLGTSTYSWGSTRWERANKIWEKA